jgi:hypothetical protein
MGIDVPWRRSTPQQRGRNREKPVLKELGAKPHPMSGAGRIKGDGSDEYVLYELKEASKSFNLSRALVQMMWNAGARQHKEPVIIVDFPGFRCTIRLERA